MCACCRLYLPLDELAEFGMSEQEVRPASTLPALPTSTLLQQHRPVSLRSHLLQGPIILLTAT